MRSRIIFCTAVAIATLAVILLAVISPVVHEKSRNNKQRPQLYLSLYIQQPQTKRSIINPGENSAFIFYHKLTEGPHNTSRVVGKAQGFIIPVQKFAQSAFNIIYLTFDIPEYSGSLGVEANHVTHDAEQKLEVVGGTGSFAFARGMAVFSRQTDLMGSDSEAMYQLKLHLKLPKHARKIPS
ncbi:hypothetical protein Sjap_016820 [Stephania japonica]|uniref:Dirigent protein n=1 Tax=Stephania japonica TaxID=461633 RepID=A0AAP0NJL2_9MAGN